MAPGFLFLNEGEIRGCVGLDEKALAVVEDCFTSLARGDVTVPEPMGIEVPEREAEITVCDLTGVGVQDTAIACLAYAKARAKGVGQEASA
jgi:ornithine cyclodeaminase